MKKPKSKEGVRRMRKKLHAGKASAPMNRSNRPMSNLEQQIADMLEGEGIDYEREKPLKYMAGWRYYDFCLIDTRNCAARSVIIHPSPMRCS